MTRNAIVLNFLLLTLLARTSSAGCFGLCSGATKLANTEPNFPSDSVETVLEQLKHSTETLTSYEARIEYCVTQPAFESKTIRKGRLYYKKYDNNSAKLRINFETLKQDDDKEQQYRDQYIFSGIWLTHIDYQIKEVEMHQLAEPNGPNQPPDVFALVKRNFPLIGFTDANQLEKDFQVKLVAQKPCESNAFAQLHLAVKPDSTYKDDYSSFDFWIDKAWVLPSKIVAVSTEEDIYEIKLISPQVNKKLKDKIFDFKIPPGFGKPEIIPLKRTRKQNH